MTHESGPRPGSKKPRTQEEMNREIDQLQSQLQKLAGTVSNVAAKRIRTTHESLETTIRENPITSVASAAAIGFLYAMIRR